MTRKPLGRGLGALLSAEGTAPATESTTDIPVDLIDPSPLQPRSVFDEAKLEELAKSISTNGVVQPVLVRRKGNRFELIAGERRFRAAIRARLTAIPAVVRNVLDNQVLEIALIENIQREDLNPIEEASAYKKLIEDLGLTQEMVADRVGRDRSYVTNYLRLLRLPTDLQDLIQAGRLSAGHARTLLGLEHVDQQRRIARRVIDKELSVRATENLVRLMTEPSSPRAQRAARAQADANVRAAENKLRRRFGTKVRILEGQGGKAGRIELEFYNRADLDRLFGMLVGAD